MVTHDPMAASYADRVVILRDGLVVGEVIGGGTAEIAAVLAQPGSAA
jgi:putative ABC transport system ATP-binding protein